MVRALALLLAALLLAWSAPAAAGGALDRFEKAHRPPPSPPPSDDDDDDEDDDDSSGSFDWGSSESSDDDDDGGSSSSADSGNWRLLLLPVCLVPPIAFSCFYPSHRVAREPYDGGDFYMRPPGGDQALFDHSFYTGAQNARTRWLEVTAGGFRAFNEQTLYAGSLDAKLWAFNLRLDAGFDHLVEVDEATAEKDHLTLFRTHLGANVLGPWVDGWELYALAGMLGVLGEAFTPAFDAGGELRAYPVEPVTFGGNALFSFFEYGPVLLDTRAYVGVTFDRIEVRAGPRFLYQGDAQGFWGPSASLSARF